MLLCLFAADHGARYCQKHCEPVNMKAFDQSEHDTRIWYHGTAASKACLQGPPPLPHPQSTRSARLARCYLSYLTRFFAFFPLYRAWSQASRRCIVERGSVSVGILTKWSLLESNTSQPGPPTLTAMLWIPSPDYSRTSDLFSGQFWDAPSTRRREKSIILKLGPGEVGRAYILKIITAKVGTIFIWNYLGKGGGEYV